MTNNLGSKLRGLALASVLHATSLVTGLTIVSLTACDQAMAQTSSTSLSGISAAESGAGETKVFLSFSQMAPTFSIDDNDSTRVTLNFDASSRGEGVKVPAALHGVLRAVELNQKGARLTVSLVGVGPIHVDASPPSGHGLVFSVTETRGVARAFPTPTTGPLPAFVDERPGEEAFEVVPLEYADISEVVGILSAGQAIKPNDSFTPQEPAFGSSSFNGGGAANGTLNGPTAPPQYSAFNPSANDTANSAYGQSVDESIGVDRRLNAIVLRGPAERVARLKAKIAALDVPVKSVLLETTFVELTETGARNIGIDFNNGNGSLAVATFQQGISSNNGPGRLNVGYGSYALQAAIFAQVAKGEGKIVSRPRISAPSGGSAKIITGDALPILTSIALSGVNAVSQQVQYVNVGVTLQIAPRVGADGYVTTHVFAEVSSVTGYSQGYPTISQREASTLATVKDGEYFIIGGLSQENHLTTRSRVPGLGDVPLAGELFKLHQENGAKTQLYIVVTPHIVTNADSQKARTAAQS